MSGSCLRKLLANSRGHPFHTMKLSHFFTEDGYKSVGWSDAERIFRARLWLRMHSSLEYWRYHACWTLADAEQGETGVAKAVRARLEAEM